MKFAFQYLTHDFSETLCNELSKHQWSKLIIVKTLANIKIESTYIFSGKHYQHSDGNRYR